MTNKELLISFFGQQNAIVCLRPVAKKYGIVEGIFISQIIYWSDRARMDGGWFAKTDKELGDETALSKKQIARCRSIFESKGIIRVKKKKFNGAPTTHYLIMMDDFFDDLSGEGEMESDQREFSNVPKGEMESDQRYISSITKNTAKNTAKNTTPDKPEDELSITVFKTHAVGVTEKPIETVFAHWCKLHREAGLGGYNGKGSLLESIDLPDDRIKQLIDRWFQERSKPGNTQFFTARIEAFAKGYSRVADDSKYKDPYDPDKWDI